MAFHSTRFFKPRKLVAVLSAGISSSLSKFSRRVMNPGVYAPRRRFLNRSFGFATSVGRLLLSVEVTFVGLWVCEFVAMVNLPDVLFPLFNFEAFNPSQSSVFTRHLSFTFVFATL